MKEKLIKNLIIGISILITAVVYSQDEFVIKENGLTPKILTSKIDSVTKSELYKKTVTWIEENKKKYKLSVDNKIENEIIHLSSIKGNAVNLYNQYFNVKYKISLEFDKEQYRLEPTQIQLKVNSKYDMGWKDFDLTNGTMFFKRGKVIRKYKSYIKDIMVLLNEFNVQLKSYLRKD